MTDLPDLQPLWEHVRANPNLAWSYLTLGKALEAHQRPIAALRSYQQAVTLRPNYAEAQFCLGRQWWKQGNLEAARSHFEKAAELRVPGVPLTLHFNRDLIYGHHGMRDPWLLWDGHVYRLYYLAGPWDEPSRSIHAAHSPDLITWHYDGTILTAPDSTISFGCGMTRIIKDRYYLYYSVRQQTDTGDRETIALATSPNHQTWETIDHDVIRLDSQYYAPHHWHTPNTFLDPQTNKVYYFWGASAATCDDPDYQACVAMAVGDRHSTSLTVLPPVLLHQVGPMGLSAFGRIDRPQIILANNQYYLIFSCASHHLHPEWRSRLVPRRLSESSMFCYVSDSITGPYRPFPDDEPFVWGSERTELIRSGVFVEQVQRKLFVYGHYPKSQLLDVSKGFPIGWNGKKLGIMFQVQIPEIRGA
ncbi:MAG: hypothetical protein EAZ61_07955 [Oscillatoriales cyanobacterium]|nr:MAG: hypothetical protein EAZ61_07955 [Oscillatoriales cyanobacterium]